MHHKSVANRLRVAQRDMLLRHIDDPVPVVAGGPDLVCRKSLVDLGLLLWSGESGAPTVGQRPWSSSITVEGREVLAFLLATYADALVAAGVGLEIPARVNSSLTKLLHSRGYGPIPTPAEAAAEA